MTTCLARSQPGLIVLAFGFLGIIAVGQQPVIKSPSSVKSTKATPVAAPPDWARDAKWYYVDVPRFRNGDPKNDHPMVNPWTTNTKFVDPWMAAAMVDLAAAHRGR